VDISASLNGRRKDSNLDLRSPIKLLVFCIIALSIELPSGTQPHSRGSRNMGSQRDDLSAQWISRKKREISACTCRSADLSAWLGKRSDKAKCFIFKLRGVAGEKNFPPATWEIGTNYIFYPMTK